ncbi:MAG: hypothetical protein ACJA1R_001667, partial [Flavobacteriales bacterium]
MTPPLSQRRLRVEHPININESLEELLTSGGDHRLRRLPETGLSKYRVAPHARDSVPLGSCTASSPSPSSLGSAERLLAELRRAPVLSTAAPAIYGTQRERLRALFEVENEVEIALLPSGTDAVYLVSEVALRFSERVHHVVVGASELGGGTVNAAKGLSVSDVAPHADAKMGAPIEGLAERCSAEPVYLRDAKGTRIEVDAVDEDVAEKVRRAARDTHVVLHMVAHSKTGLCSPSARLCRELQSELGDRLTVLLDAAQGRLAPRDIRNALSMGFVALFTGSKFYGGPPFSCALLFPPGRAADPGPLSRGLSDWFSRADLPAGWSRAKESLREPYNLGLLLRWEAALHEIERYHSLRPRDRAGAYHTFSGAVHEVFGPSEIIELDVPRPPTHELLTALGAYPTVFGFRVHGENGPLKATALQKLHTLLDTDLADSGLPPGTWHLGQPVPLGPPTEDRAALLRVALGARLVSEHAETPDAAGGFFRNTLRG